ncbi:MAG: aminoglycoside phosphotransferase (APT) family kinase protein [Chlamydiales bacterium]
MTVLQGGLALVDEAMEWGPQTRDLERVEVQKTGGVLFTAIAEGSLRWFAFDSGSFDELHPHGDTRVDLCRTLTPADAGRIVSWRPGRRVCLRSERKGQSCFLKGYRKRKAAAALANHQRAQVACDTPNGFVVPRVLHSDGEQGSIVMSALQGAPLAVKADQVHSFVSIGRALRDLQATPAIQDLAQHGAPEELTLLETLARRTEPVLGSLPAEWAATLARLSLTPPPIATTVATHRDLHVGQFLRMQDAVGLLDFDLMCQAPPSLDLGNLIVHLHLKALQGLDGCTDADADRCIEALLEGYGGSLDGEDPNALRFFKATTYLRLALIYAIRPRWASLADPLTRLAKHCIDEQV